MAVTISVAQQKGGAGKTTIAAHLGMAWVGQGKRVAFVDIDPQGSLSAWAGMRDEGDRPVRATYHRFEGWKTSNEIAALRRDHDIIVIDSPPHMETAARLSVREADLVVIPVQPTPMDVWATAPTIEMAETEKVPYLMVFNRVPPRAKIADELIAQLKKEKRPLARAKLGNRTVGYDFLYLRDWGT
ncbi:MAG: ParA family protein [Alphaproteobacteria bacterium]|nr:ParA family protein [Alphaproteobacteria bacterium]